jgi:Spy/CpxP family protein refolding chaperone
MSIAGTVSRYRTTGRGRLFFAVAIGIIAAAGAAVAAHRFSDTSRRVQWHRGRAAADSIEAVRQSLERGSPWLDLLKVSEPQRTQLLAIIDRHEAALRRLESDQDHLVDEFSTIARADVLNPADIEHARTGARALSDQAIDESVAMVTEAVQLLTPAQRRRLVALWRAR